MPELTIRRDAKGQIWSHIRQGWFLETPEETVRQNYVCTLVNAYGFQLAQMAEEIVPEFLWLALQTQPMRAQIETAARTAVRNYAIGGADIWRFEFPLPTLNVQRKLASELSRARAHAMEQRKCAEELRTRSRMEVEDQILGRSA